MQTSETKLVKPIINRRSKYHIIEPYLKQRLDLGVQPPPLPVSELQVGSAIPLKDANGVQLLGSFDVIPVSKRNCHYNSNNGKKFFKAIGAFQIA